MIKYHQPLFIGLLISFLSLSIAAPVRAESKISATPTNLTVAGKRCFINRSNCKQAKRHLLLRSQQEVTNIKIISSDLNRTDAAQVFPADAIKINSANISTTIQQLNANESVTVPIEFNLQNIPSGEFNGTLLVTYADGEIIIPVNIKVKDNWFLPLLVLLLGVSLGIAISAYRNEGMARDEVLVKVGRIRSRVRADNELDKAFTTKINAYLVEVETAIENKNWQTAAETVNQAQKTWDKWRKGKSDWLDLLKSESELQECLNKEYPQNSKLNIPYLQNIRWELQKTRRNLAAMDTPDNFSQSLKEVRQQLNRYLQGKTQYEKFSELRLQLPDAVDNKTLTYWDLEDTDLEQKLYNLPNQDEAFTQWQQEVKNKSQELIQVIEQQSNQDSTNQQAENIARSIKNPIPNTQISPIPDIQPFDKEKVDKSAGQRLYLFNIVSYAIAIFLLGGAGFTQLYAANKTFGSNGLTEYFALLAWGFGAEATRETVTKVLQDWKQSGEKDKS
ncbi:MAG: hypothetical protein HC836_12150 [Richelia sp. RM2_1_2]|nr:hypothetical protein [Richelia sp. SM1_7_0]NJN09397.1 hypothetical protein [Richelia sp. RM1_1_1]NJO59049.1 hypothetical protein [Richelia sp. RM2_1_2]